MYLLCMLILSSCSDDVCRVDGKMSDFPGETTVYLLSRTGEFTHDTLMQTVMKDGSFRLEIPRDLWGEQYSLKFGDKRSSVEFFAEQGNVRVEGNGKTIYDAEVTGTALSQANVTFCPGEYGLDFGIITYIMYYTLTYEDGRMDTAAYSFWYLFE